MNRLNYYSIIRALALFAVFTVFGSLIVSHFFVTAETFAYENFLRESHLYYFFDLLSFVAIPLLAYGSTKIHIRRKPALGILLCVIFLLWIFCGVLFKFPIYEDAQHVINIAIHGITDRELDYFTRYPFQYGFILLMRSIYLLVGENLLILGYRVASFVSYVFAMVFTFKLCEAWFKDRVSYCGLIVLQLCWYIPIGFINYVYGLSIGLSFSMIAIYFYFLWLDHLDYHAIIYTLIFLCVAISVKPNYLIVLLGMMVHQLFIRSDIRKKIITLFLLGLTLVGQSVAIEFLAQKFDGVTTNEVVPRSAWIITGGPHFEECSIPLYDYTLPGFHNGYDAKIDVLNQSNEQNIQQVNSDLAKLADYVIQNPVNTLKFYKDKLLLTYNTSDFMLTALSFAHYFEQTDELNSLQQSYIDHWFPSLLEFSNFGYLLMMCCFLIGVWVYRHDDCTYLFCIILGGVFVYHLFAETKPSYVYPFITMMMPLSVGGLQHFGCYLSNRFSSKSGRIGIVCTFTCAILLTLWYNPKRVLEPIFECYTDGKQYELLEPQHYYYLPFLIDETRQIDAIEVRIGDQNRVGNNDGLIHATVIDDIKNNYGYYTLRESDIPSYEWSRISVDLNLSKGKYYLQLFVDDSAASDDFYIRTGIPYGNFDKFMIDQFPSEYSADIKIMTYDTYPFQFYGFENVPAFDIMSRQPYAAMYYD